MQTECERVLCKFARNYRVAGRGDETGTDSVCPETGSVWLLVPPGGSFVCWLMNISSSINGSVPLNRSKGVLLLWLVRDKIYYYNGWSLNGMGWNILWSCGVGRIGVERRKSREKRNREREMWLSRNFRFEWSKSAEDQIRRGGD